MQNYIADPEWKYFDNILFGLNLKYQEQDPIWMSSESDWKKLLGKIRFINPENKFDYAKYGNYLFIEDELYITTDRPGYKSFDINNSFRQLEINKLLNNQSKYLIKGIFAGFDTLSRDIYNERIYYGDILKIDVKKFTKCKNCNPNNIFSRLDNDIVYGPLSFMQGWGDDCSILEEIRYGDKKGHIFSDVSYTIADQAFGIMPKLCQSYKTEIVANVYYDLNFESKFKFDLNVISKAILSDWGSISCEFWNKYVPKKLIKSLPTNVDIWNYAIENYNKTNGRK